MRVAVSLQRDGVDDWASAVRFAQEAERLGVNALWSAEAWGHDGITPLAYLAGQTETIQLGTGIMQAGTRTPALVGMTAMSMQSISGGRFRLGLGTSGPQVIEGWHGVPFEGAVSRMGEIVEIVRTVCRGEKLSHSGRHYTLPLPTAEGKAIRSGAPPVDPPPIYLASLGPRSLRLTGAIADGWLGTSFIPETADVFTDDPEPVLQSHARGLAFTLGAMGSPTRNFYNDAFCRQGWADTAKEVQRLWIEGKRDEARARVPLELAQKVNCIGDDAAIKERLRIYRDAGVTTLQPSVEGSNVDERVENLERFTRLVDDISGRG